MVRTRDVSQSKRAVFMISATDAAQGTQVEIITEKIVYIFPLFRFYKQQRFNADCRIPHMHICGICYKAENACR